MLCRLCLVEPTTDVLNIFDCEGIRLQIADIISKHFWFSPLKNDPVSDKICCSCWGKVNDFHQFYSFVEEAHKNLINISQTTSADINLSTFLPVPVGDLKKEIDNLENNKNNEWHLEDLPEIKICPEINLDKKDPLTDATVDYKTEENLTESYVEKDLAKHKKLEAVAKRKSTRICRNTKKQHDARLDEEESNQNNESTTKSSTYNESKINKKCRKKTTFTTKTITNEDENELLEKKLAQQKQFDEEDQMTAKLIRMECSICYADLKNFTDLRLHIKKEHKKEGYVLCCNKKIFERKALLDHYSLHLNPEAFKCLHCGKNYSDSYCLKYHIELKHETDESKLFKCDKCPKKFSRKTMMDRHKLIHVPVEERPLQCDSCEKRFVTEKSMLSHKRLVHWKSYALVCDICAKVLPARNLLEKHRLEHEGIIEPKAQCKICDAWLKNKLSLYKHMRIHEDASKEIKCNICGKIAPTYHALKSHVRYVHTKKRTFECYLCPKAFKDELTLKEHLTIHTGGALYGCNYCSKTFNSNANMYAHRKRAHPQEWEQVKRQRTISTKLPLSKNTATTENETTLIGDTL